MSIEIQRQAAGNTTSPGFPMTRLRRLRQHPMLRELVRENELSVNDLILPLFIRHGQNTRIPITSMPGHAQLTVDLIPDEVREIESLRIPAVILFGIPERKDAIGAESWDEDGVVHQAIRSIKEKSKTDLLVIVDLCFCEYTDHGHCGVVTERTGRCDVDNDATLENLTRQAVSLARAGADLIAPSGMMDGMVAAIRQGLDAEGMEHLPIMSYAVKYASAFYGPFRQAAESAPQFGDRRSYQMDPANSDEALREAELDLREGADMIMVKPAMAYGDIIRRVKDRFGVPVAAYNVSGEFAMVKAAAERGWIDEQRIMLEILTGIKRAGADCIVTYFAKDVARYMSGK
jgi:porphobilinogen synthase